MAEKWVRWQPAEDVSGRLDLYSISEGQEALKIVLYDWDNKDKKIFLTFDSFLGAYRKTYETFRSELISSIHKQYGKEFFIRCSFFKVHNSEYVQWLSEQSNGSSDYPPFQHMSLLLIDSVIDVISMEDPQIQIVIDSE